MRYPMYTGKFMLCLSHTLRWEGGYVNDPVDPGGETNMGVTKRTYPHLDIKNLSYDQAVEIYWQDFWLPSRAQDLGHLPLAAKYFDLCVNMGRRRATKLLQQATNLATSTSLQVDGIIGVRTLDSINLAANQAVLLEALLAQGRAFYESLITRRPAMAKFRRGWFNRLEDTLC